MGNCLCYLDRDKDLGEISKGRWKVVRRLLVVFIDYVNDAMREPWGAGHYRNVVLREGGPTPAPEWAQGSTAPPAGPFSLDTILDDLSEQTDEIIFLDAAELGRFFAWASFLESRDGAFEFFAPLVATLREKTTEVEAYVADR